MKRYLYTVCFFLVFSCTNTSLPHNLDKLKVYFKENNTDPQQKFNTFNYIVIINEIGDCINCNNLFSKKIANSIEREDVLFILSGNGTKVDISDFIDKDYPNVIWDQNADFNQLNIVDKCAILELSKDSILSTTLINTDNVKSIVPF